MPTAPLIIDLQHAILARLADPARQPDIDAKLSEVADRLGELKRKAKAAGVPVLADEDSHFHRGDFCSVIRGSHWHG